MAFRIEDLMTKIVPGASPGTHLWACPDDTVRQVPCPDDSHGQGDCPDDNRGQRDCPDDSRGQRDCPDDSRDQGDCPDDSRDQGDCPDDSHGRQPPQGRQAGSALALLRRQLREHLNQAPEARI
jgi:hypothetical protein